MRVGIGYDSHRFAARSSTASAVILGGVRIPHERRLEGHSDADVLLHAITDALLGAIAAPDIGALFPPSDPTHRGAASRVFLEEAARRVHRAGWRIGNIDSTVIADAPKLQPHKATMQTMISRLLKIERSAVSVKAKTTEGLAPGDAGIAAQAVVLLRPADSGRRRKRS